MKNTIVDKKIKYAIINNVRKSRNDRYSGVQRLEDLVEAAAKGIDSRVDFANRRVYLVGEVNEDSVSRFLLGFQMMDSLPGPIEVILCSCGGEANGGFGIYDTMKLSKNKVTVKVYGETMSIAMLCLQGGDLRLVAPTSRFMVHDGFQPMEGNYSHKELVAIAKEFVASNQIYYELLAERSGLPIEKLKEMCSKETYMSAKQMVQLKLADGIIPSIKSPKIRKTK